MTPFQAAWWREDRKWFRTTVWPHLTERMWGYNLRTWACALLRALCPWKEESRYRGVRGQLAIYPTFLQHSNSHRNQTVPAGVPQRRTLLNMMGRREQGGYYRTCAWCNNSPGAPTQASHPREGATPSSPFMWPVTSYPLACPYAPACQPQTQDPQILTLAIHLRLSGSFVQSFIHPFIQQTFTE